LTSEEALQQAQAEGLTLRAAENRTGYLGLYYSNMHVERARTRYFGVYLDTTYGHHSKPYKARVNRSNSGELDEWGLHNSSHLADYTTAEAAALAIARNAVEEEWRAHGCEARGLRKEVREVCATCPDYDLANVTATLRKGGSLLVAASAAGVRLHHVPVHESLVRPGMRAEFRKAPAFEGETVYVDIYANTGDQQLAIWEISFSYDPALLTLKRGTQSTYFQAPVCICTC
jgi:hypothetical protein